MKKIIPRPFWLALFLSIVTQAAYLPSGHSFSLLGFQDLGHSTHWFGADLEGGLTFAIAPNFLGAASGDGSLAVANAFDTWSAAGTGLSFTESGMVGFGPYWGANIDVFSMPSYFRYGQYGFNGALALALVGSLNGTILGVDIFFNQGYTWTDNPGPGEFDIESVALHEIGHALGLDHPDIGDDLGRNYNLAGATITATGFEVMNSTIVPGEISRFLTSDELAGLDYLYPSSRLLLASVITAVSQDHEAVPEPSTFLLLGSGLVGLLALARRGLCRRFLQ